MDMYAKVIADSISETGHRITSIECRYPRFIHSEMMTHRVFSRNASSSRAIPTKKLVELVRTDPVLPIEWGRNQSGMSADTLLEAAVVQNLETEWRALAAEVADVAARWAAAGLHKQVVNRILEPFLPITVLITATEWSNFFDQRCSPNAQPEIRRIAELMRDAMSASKPEELGLFQWHSPYVTKEELQSYHSEDIKKISVARCARTSYLNHDGKNDIESDIKLWTKLRDNKHLSPFEHVARPVLNLFMASNYSGWISYRHEQFGR